MSSRKLRGFATEPENSGTKYTPQEALRLQEIFRPQSDLYRRRRRQAFISLLVGGVPFVGSLLLNGFSKFLLDRTPIPPSADTLLAILALLSLAIGMGFMWSLPPLKCPACHSFLDRGISRHCPECGSDQLDTDMFGQLRCNQCQKNLETGRNRSRPYRIHACTGCGVMLDYHGL